MNLELYNLSRRSWILALCCGLSKSGFTPLKSDLLHKVLFFANCLSPIYKQSPPSNLVMKHRRGPFYPTAQHDLDRLAIQGFLSITDFRYESDTNGVWTYANYSVNTSGAEFVKTLTKFNKWNKIVKYLDDIAYAYSEIQSEISEKINDYDLTYNSPGKSLNDVIDFSKIELNYSARTSKAFFRISPSVLIPYSRDVLVLYMKFLESKAA